MTARHDFPARALRDAVALITGVLADPEPNQLLDTVLETVIDDLRTTEPADTVAVFAGIVTHLVDELAATTATPRGELWQGIAEHVSARLTSRETNNG